MNRYGVLNNADFRNGVTDIRRSDYSFPDEVGVNTVSGTLVCKYWGNKDNLILLIDTDCGKKLKFSFWKNTNYCCEPRALDIDSYRDSVKNLIIGTRLKLTYQRSENAGITRIRSIVLL